MDLLCSAIQFGKKKKNWFTPNQMDLPLIGMAEVKLKCILENTLKFF